MKKTFLLTLLFVIAGTQPVQAEQTCELSLYQVARTAPQNSSNENGILWLMIKNLSSERVQIPLCACFPKIAAGTSKVENATEFDIPLPQIRYAWEDTDGTIVSGIYYHTGSDNIELNPNQKRSLFIPVVIPKHSGRYRLEVEFDNTHIQRTLEARNFHRPKKLHYMRLKMAKELEV